MHGLPNLPPSAMQAYDVLSLPVWLFSIETLEILASNPAAQTWLGFDAQTLQAMTIADMCPKEDRVRLIDRVRQFVETTTDAGSWTIVAKSGDRYTASFIWTKLIFDGTEAIVISISDITRLQEAEEQVLEAARLRRFTSHLTRLGSWRLDLEQQSITWDAETAKIHDEPEGTSPTPDQAIKYYVPEHREKIYTLFEACIKHGHFFDETLQIITAKGRKVWVRAIGEAVRNEVGETIAVEGALQEISDLVVAQDATKGLSERLRNSLEDISDAFYLLDYNWEFIFLNGPAETLLRRSKEELLGKSAWDVLSSSSRIKFQEQYKRAIITGQAVRFQEFYLPVKRWLEVDAHPTPVGWAVYLRDITEAKNTQQALLVSEERFRFIAKATRTTLWEFDIANNSQWWCEGLENVFGHVLNRIESPPTVWETHIHPDDKGRNAEAFSMLISGQIDTLYEKYRFQRADGSWAQVEERAFVARNEDGLPIKCLGSMSDISERVELEERLHQAQKMEVVGQLTGGVAHDFNNLLTVMMGFAEILSDDLSGQPDLQKLAVMILSAADTGAELITSLLAFSRKQALQPQILNLDPLLQGMDALLRRTLPENINIKILHTGGLWKTEVDPSQIETALLNLTLNARDAMPDGGSLTIETTNTSLDEDYVAKELDVKAGQYVQIVVTDTGHGILPEVIGHIFEPFFTTKEAGLGSGLGLSMIYGFIKQSGGHIRAYSELGEGTTFRLYLPRSQGKVAQVHTDCSDQKIVGGSELLLVVEDDILVRNFISVQLKGLGYQILEAPDGTEALLLLDQHPEIDMLFTDVVMPGDMGGPELADAACALKPDLKVLFTTGYTENSIVRTGSFDTRVDLLRKPYRRNQLAARVRKVLDDPH